MFGFKSKKDKVSKDGVIGVVTSGSDTDAKIVDEVTNSSGEEISPEQAIEPQIPTLTRKEFKHLKRARYNETKDKFDKSFVLLNEKTGQIVEINAASSYHAANIIGWKSRVTRVLEVKTKNEPAKV